MAAPAPSAAAAAGAAAAALLQRQLAGDGNRSDALEGGWTEHQTGDGRKFFANEATQMSTWEKPAALMTAEEKMNDTQWTEYRIWDGRVFYYNKDTKVSCWRMPPELRKMREGISGIDDRPLPLTMAERRRTFLDAMKTRGVDTLSAWEATDDALADTPEAEELTEASRKQAFAELLSLAMRRRQIDEREKQRNAANALERLIEERFGAPEQVDASYEDAARLLGNTEPWKTIKSDVRRHEVFQAVMERLEEKHKKVQVEKRSERVVRLQRFLGSDPQLKRTRLRWKDAVAILGKRGELHEEGDQPLEAVRIWSSLRTLKQASEHEAIEKAKVKGPDSAAYREDRKRRDAFLACLKEMVQKGRLNDKTSWMAFEVKVSDPRVTAMRDARGATAMELFEEFKEDLREGRIQNLEVVEEPKEELGEPHAKRHRFDDPDDSPFAAAQAAAQAAAHAQAARRVHDGESALDAMIMMGGAGAPADDSSDSDDEDDDEDDPLMGVVNRAAAAKRAAEGMA